MRLEGIEIYGPKWQSLSADTKEVFPADLKANTSAHNLIRWILELQPEQLHKWCPSHSLGELGSRLISPSALFTLIIYCYSTGIYASSEVEEQSEIDDFLKYICANTIPNESLIRRFRRDHQEDIISCLAAILYRACKENLQKAYSRSNSSWESCSLGNNNSLAHVRMVCLIEAQRRYLSALQLDSMAMDI